MCSNQKEDNLQQWTAIQQSIYSNKPNNEVDWASLAKQWIALQQNEVPTTTTTTVQTSFLLPCNEQTLVTQQQQMPPQLQHQHQQPPIHQEKFHPNFHTQINPSIMHNFGHPPTTQPFLLSHSPINIPPPPPPPLPQQTAGRLPHQALHPQFVQFSIPVTGNPNSLDFLASPFTIPPPLHVVEPPQPHILDNHPRGLSFFNPIHQHNMRPVMNFNNAIIANQQLANRHLLPPTTTPSTFTTQQMLVDEHYNKLKNNEEIANFVRTSISPKILEPKENPSIINLMKNSNDSKLSASNQPQNLEASQIKPLTSSSATTTQWTNNFKPKFNNLNFNSSNIKHHRNTFKQRNFTSTNCQFQTPTTIDSLPIPEVETYVKIDPQKRKILPAWIREGLETMEREKQKKAEKEREDFEREHTLRLQKEHQNDLLKKIESNELGYTDVHASNDEEQDNENEQVEDTKNEIDYNLIAEQFNELLMLKVRQMLTDVLLEVTNKEIKQLVNEVHEKHKAQSKVTAIKQLAKPTPIIKSSGLDGLLSVYASDSDNDDDGGGDDRAAISNAANDGKVCGDGLLLNDEISKEKATTSNNNNSNNNNNNNSKENNDNKERNSKYDRHSRLSNSSSNHSSKRKHRSRSRSKDRNEEKSRHDEDKRNSNKDRNRNDNYSKDYKQTSTNRSTSKSVSSPGDRSRGEERSSHNHHQRSSRHLSRSPKSYRRSASRERKDSYRSRSKDRFHSSRRSKSKSRERDRDRSRAKDRRR